ncbi:MAG: phage tail protein, partial [Idiomarina sp.]|nr:phage tail protein [Idiomarina sp.]
GGIQSLTISGSGVFTDATSETTLRGLFGASALASMSFIIPDLGTYAGNFQITSLEYAGEFNGEATYSLTAESGGTISFTAA